MWKVLIFLSYFFVLSSSYTFGDVCGGLKYGNSVHFQANPDSNLTLRFQSTGKNCSSNGETDVEHFYILQLGFDAANKRLYYSFGPDIEPDVINSTDYTLSQPYKDLLDVEIVFMEYSSYAVIINGKSIVVISSPYGYFPVNCIYIHGDDIKLNYYWIEGNEYCPDRVLDKPDPSRYVWTTTPTTTTTTIPPFPDHFPPSGWPECNLPFCYPSMEFPCPKACYSGGPYYCPPNCYEMPGRGYYPPPVYPPCNMRQLPSCLPIPPDRG
ncbi:unnamed protein product [Bursaphelenchus xylophilus]|uniref:(pine wood nematode) hypothetical protein n=1 Tax=Bursaphelenchus xylophilus TaxID=6326 RepID=A0A1I7SX98_BURXY|nr:unnamed protein product [Bursaphelenchus xylophilus]CAG9100274.1 unnamed protein product [Bursaphelenchus xylophilus]